MKKVVLIFKLLLFISIAFCQYSYKKILKKINKLKKALLKMKNNYLTALFFLLLIISCKSIPPNIEPNEFSPVSIMDMKDVENERINLDIKNTQKLQKELSIHFLNNTKWVFDNYSNNTIETYNYKKPTLTFTINDKKMTLKGNSFINEYNGKFKYDYNKKLLNIQLEASNKNNDDNLLKKIEFDYFNNLQNVISCEVYKNLLIFQLNDKIEKMVFRKVEIQN